MSGPPGYCGAVAGVAGPTGRRPPAQPTPLDLAGGLTVLAAADALHLAYASLHRVDD
ncbi:hypothetical protein [Kribbella swartbergensis]